MCDVSQFHPDRLVQSITGVAVRLQVVNVKQNNIVPDSPLGSPGSPGTIHLIKLAPKGVVFSFSFLSRQSSTDRLEKLYAGHFADRV